MFHDRIARRGVPSFAARLIETLAATDRFVSWWGAHRAWPANEPPRVERRGTCG